MTNHTHLLVTPGQEHSVNHMMQDLGCKYVRYINKAYHRSGTLWESRHKASLINAEEYLFTCMRYIELNPVRANMVTHPADYCWSSYQVNAQGVKSKIIKPHSLYEALDTSPQQRQYVYRRLFEHQLDKENIHYIRIAAQFSMPLGNDKFMKQIEVTLGRSIGQAKRGRPSVKEEEGYYFI